VLPAQNLRLLAATEVVTSPEQVDGGQTWKFEARVVGRYSDPVSADTARVPALKRAAQQKMTTITSQYLYASTDHPKFGKIISSPNFGAGSKLYVDADYVFPTEDGPGYFEIKDLSYMETFTPRSGVASTLSPSTPRRRDVAFKGSTPSPPKSRSIPRPARFGVQMSESVAGPSSSVNFDRPDPKGKGRASLLTSDPARDGSGYRSPSFTATGSQDMECSSTGVFSDVDVDDVDTAEVVEFPRPPKRPAASTSTANGGGVKRNRRLRKPTQKSLELDRDSV
jgi:hypothetical protein